MDIRFVLSGTTMCCSERIKFFSGGIGGKMMASTLTPQPTEGLETDLIDQINVEFDFSTWKLPHPPPLCLSLPPARAPEWFWSTNKCSIRFLVLERGRASPTPSRLPLAPSWGLQNETFSPGTPSSSNPGPSLFLSSGPIAVIFFRMVSSGVNLMVGKLRRIHDFDGLSLKFLSRM